MKRLINDKKYDIQGAKLVAEFNNDLDRIDPESCIEELYLKKSGEYFLYGRGGVMTQWSDSNEDKGEGITPITAEEAQDWIDIHSHSRDHYADLFGEAEE